MASDLEMQEAEDAIDHHRDRIAELEAEVERLTKERDEAKAGWSGCASVLMDVRSELAKALSRTGAVKVLDPDMPAQEMHLHMGEMTAQEMRTARAAIRWANTRLSALEPAAPEGQQPGAWLAEGPGWKRVFLDREAADNLVKGEWGASVSPLYTRPAEQAVTEAQMQAVGRIIELAIMRHGVHELEIQGTLDDAKDALKAAMEAGRHDSR